MLNGNLFAKYFFINGRISLPHIVPTAVSSTAITPAPYPWWVIQTCCRI